MGTSSVICSTPAAHPDRVAGNPIFVGKFAVLDACVLLSPWGCAGPWSSCRQSGEVLTNCAEEQLAVVAISAAARLQARAAMGCPLRSIPP